ncbi:Lon protease 1 [Abditibacteriota bacterium]|nr:Lon protease 1 [Abditibacteriota bacterium]
MPASSSARSGRRASTSPTESKPKRRRRKSDNEAQLLAPVVPLRGMVAFPAMVLPLFIGRAATIEAVTASEGEGKLVFLVAQRDEETEEPAAEDLYEVGVVGEIMQSLKLPDGNLRVVVEGRGRARALSFSQNESHLLAQVVPFEEGEAPEQPETEALLRHLRDEFENAVNLSKKIPPEAMAGAGEQETVGALADLVASFLELSVAERQSVLENADPVERARAVLGLLSRELHIMELDREIEAQVKEGIGDNQREYFLRERLRTIQQKLGETDPTFRDAEGLRARVEEANMPTEAKEKALYELDRLERMPPVAPEVGSIRSYVELMCDLPWDKRTVDSTDLDHAQEVLDDDHYALGKIKERILEFLAVRQLNPGSRGPILCFMGPPGVGKTSIGKSIATALGREYVRVSVGGVHDEAEVRGHRRTYIGSMPGRIIAALRRVKTKNPVFLLDEIDKLGHDYRGDPSSALLEALDPEQNKAFADHYLEVPFDLSEVMFIATGNLLDPIQPALRDRMEVLTFPGYTEREKLAIANGFLIPKQVRENGITDEHISFSEEGLSELVRGYTREAGVRNLEREIGTVCRKVARRVAQGQSRAKKNGKEETAFERIEIVADNLNEFLGPRRFSRDLAIERDEIGTAQGLAWTEVGGEVLPIEVLLTVGMGNSKMTGNLGQVMKESVDAAMTYARAHALELGIEADFAARHDAHIHVPSGAVPKDGPSAGVAMATALVSAMSGRPVRKEIAMTGEISLRGHVMPVGGVKEKILAAHRVGATEIIMPAENERDLSDLPSEVRDALKFHLVSRLNEALGIALYPIEAPDALIADIEKSDLSDADKELLKKSETEREPDSDYDRDEDTFEIPKLEVQDLEVEHIDTEELNVHDGKEKPKKKREPKK